MTRASLLALMMGTLASSALADWVVLNNGQKLRGEIISSDETEVQLQMPTMMTRIKQADIKTIEREKPEVYFEAVARAYLKRANWVDATTLLARGVKKCPDAKALATLAKATASMRAAVAAEQKMELAAAIEHAGAAKAAAPKVTRFAKELERLTRAKAFMDERGTLPGDLLEYVHPYKVTVLHHHRAKALEWGKAAEQIMRDTVKQIRRSRAHKLPSMARLVLVVHRNAEEFAVATKKAKPHSELPETKGGRLMSRTRAVTHMAAVDKALAPLVARWTARQMYEFHPTWLIEGLVVGGSDKTQEAKHRDAAANLQEAGKLLPLAKFMRLSHFGMIEDFVARQQFVAQSGAFTRYVAGLPDGLRQVTRANEKARNMMLYALLDPRRKHYKLKSYRIEDLVPQFLVHSLPDKLGFKNLDALEKDFHHWIATGGRKGKKPRKKRR